MIPTTLTPVATANGELRAPVNSQSWQVGMLLKAIALTSTHNGSVRLQVGAHTLDATTNLRLQQGQHLRLRVADTGRSLVLRTEAGTQADLAGRVREGIRSSLPRQTAQAPLIAAALAATKTPAALPPVVTRALSAFADRITPAGELLTSSGLRDAINRSGTFLENHIAAGRTEVLAQDWKAMLLQLRQRLAAGQQSTGPASTATTQGSTSSAAPTTTSASASPTAPATGTAPATAPATTPSPSPTTVPTTALASASTSPTARPDVARIPDLPSPPMRQQPPVAQPVVRDVPLPAEPARLLSQLSEMVDGALARNRLSQLNSLNGEATSARQVWLVELPVRHANGDVEVVPLRIERDDKTATDASRGFWAVNLAFDLGKGGQLRARVALRDDQVYTSFWAEDQHTRAAVDDDLDILRQAFAREKLSVGCLTCSAAQSVPSGTDDAALLDTRA